jgi:chromosome partitioning protein
VSELNECRHPTPTPHKSSIFEIFCFVYDVSERTELSDISARLDISGMRQVLAVCNQKGGVGKTTLTINLGAALSDLGERVLLIDLDPQGHLTEGVGLQDSYLGDGPSIYDCLVGSGDTRIDDFIHENAAEHFSVIPATYQLMLAEQSLFMARNREHKLKGLLNGLNNRFDWILIDCPPALGNLTDNALNAARQVVVPIQAEQTSVRALELLFDQIESIERGLNIRIRVLAVVPNLVQDSALSKRIISEIKESIPEVTPFELRKRVLLQEAWSTGKSIFAYEPSSTSQAHTQKELTDLYRELARLVMQRAGADSNAK